MAYKYFPAPYAGDFGGSYQWIEEANRGIELESMKKLVKENYRLSNCDKCGCSLNYLGMGQYVCPECGEKYMDAIGRVNKAIAEVGRCSITMLATRTGLSVRTIKTLIEDGYVSVA